MNKWFEDPDVHDLGCGDNSCKYVRPTGMATNGGCRCARNKPQNVERFLQWNYHKALKKIEELEASIEIEKMLEDANVDAK